MRRPRVLIAVLVFSCSACASVESQAKYVRVTSDETAVSDCIFRGFVESQWSYGTPSAADSELRYETVEHGGNVVLKLGASMGEAYSCSAAPSGTSPPNSFVPAEMTHRLPTGPYCPPSID